MVYKLLQANIFLYGPEYIFTYVRMSTGIYCRYIHVTIPTCKLVKAFHQACADEDLIAFVWEASMCMCLCMYVHPQTIKNHLRKMKRSKTSYLFSVSLYGTAQLKLDTCFRLLAIVHRFYSSHSSKFACYLCVALVVS